MKFPPIILSYENSLPKSLAALLEEMLYPSDPPENHQAFLDEVMAAKAKNDAGKACPDEGIKHNVEYSKAPREEAYYYAYIQYIGMALHYLENSKYDAAWYYYAQSRYYRGLLDARESVMRQIETEFQSIDAKRLGGKNKAAKQTGAMKDELVNIIENPPDGGWKSRKQLINTARPLLEKFREETGQVLPLYENILTNISGWLRQDLRISKAFIENSADPNLAMDDLSEKSSDPNSKFGL